MTRVKLAAGAAALGFLALVPSAGGVAVPKEVFYKIKLAGTQTTTWSYRDSVTELGCVRSMSGSGSERYDFSTSQIRVLVRQFRGLTGIEIGRNKGVFTQHQIAGKSNRSQSGDCTPVNENGDTRGCGKDSFRIPLLLGEGRNSISFIPQHFKFYNCPSGISGPGASGGHRLETASGKVNWNELLRSRSKKVRAEFTTVHKITGFRGQVIGQERTRLVWTMTFQRVGR